MMIVQTLKLSYEDIHLVFSLQLHFICLLGFDLTHPFEELKYRKEKANKCYHYWSHTLHRSYKRQKIYNLPLCVLLLFPRI